MGLWQHKGMLCKQCDSYSQGIPKSSTVLSTRDLKVSFDHSSFNKVFLELFKSYW